MPTYSESLDHTMLQDIAQSLAAPGKGILASDESTSTIGKRLEKHGIENTYENRRHYRSLFYTAPGIEKAISGCILFPETLLQKADDGRMFVEWLREKNILVGVKVDEGLEGLECIGGESRYEGRSYEGETHTKGMDSLRERCVEYKKQGAVFAKWRAAIRICNVDGEYKCSDKAIQVNADELAQYASICQECGIVPIVEPEILIDGGYDVETSERISKKVLGSCIAALWRWDVDLSGCLIKPQMVTPGAEARVPAQADEIAVRTLRVLRQTIPPAVPGIMFLSGGQSEAQATENLNMLNVTAKTGDAYAAPWALSFSFGRALQASVLHVWSTKGPGSEDECKELARKVAEVNGAATRGVYVDRGAHPSVMSRETSLQETFRGWRPS